MEQHPDPYVRRQWAVRFTRRSDDDHYVSTWGRRLRRSRVAAPAPQPEKDPEWPLSEKATASLASYAGEWPLSDEWVMPSDPIELTPPDAWESNPT